MRTDIKTVFELTTNSKQLKDMQKKINQWITTGLMIKVETDLSGDNILWKIILKKEA